MICHVHTVTGAAGLVGPLASFYNPRPGSSQNAATHPKQAIWGPLLGPLVPLHSWARRLRCESSEWPPGLNHKIDFLCHYRTALGVFSSWPAGHLAFLALPNPNEPNRTPPNRTKPQKNHHAHFLNFCPFFGRRTPPHPAAPRRTPPNQQALMLQQQHVLVGTTNIIVALFWPPPTEPNRTEPN